MIIFRCEEGAVRKKVIVSIAVLGFALFAWHKWQAHQKQLALERDIAIEAEVRKMLDHGALDGPSPSELIANPPPAPIRNINPPPQLSGLPSTTTHSSKDSSDEFERDQIRREIDSLKRQADLDRMNREIERADDERKARRKELEHSLGLDHP